MKNAVVSADILGVVLIVLVYVGESVDAPPSLIDVGVTDERVPVVVFAVLGLVCTGLGIASVLVEVNAVRTGV